MTNLPTCPASGMPWCVGCFGPIYLCDPEKNTECRKTACGKECHYTHRQAYSANGVPICPTPVKFVNP